MLSKSEVIKLVSVLVVVVVGMEIAFYKQDVLTNLRTGLAVFWMMVLPGYMLLYYWKEKIDFTERIIIGSALALGVIAVSSYYLGLIGVHIKFQGILLPLLMIAVGVGAKKFS